LIQLLQCEFKIVFIYLFIVFLKFKILKISLSYAVIVIEIVLKKHKTKEDRPLCYVHILYVKGVSEKFRRIGNRYHVRMIFKT
jgi:hypothetical protein